MENSLAIGLNLEFPAGTFEVGMRNETVAITIEN
jgi:hypothetical protein